MTTNSRNAVCAFAAALFCAAAFFLIGFKDISGKQFDGTEWSILFSTLIIVLSLSRSAERNLFLPNCVALGLSICLSLIFRLKLQYFGVFSNLLLFFCFAKLHGIALTASALGVFCISALFFLNSLSFAIILPWHSIMNRSELGLFCIGVAVSAWLGCYLFLRAVSAKEQ